MIPLGALGLGRWGGFRHKLKSIWQSSVLVLKIKYAWPPLGEHTSWPVIYSYYLTQDTIPAT